MTMKEDLKETVILVLNFGNNQISWASQRHIRRQSMDFPILVEVSDWLTFCEHSIRGLRAIARPCDLLGNSSFSHSLCE